MKLKLSRVENFQATFCHFNRELAEVFLLHLSLTKIILCHFVIKTKRKVSGMELANTAMSF